MAVFWGLEPEKDMHSLFYKGKDLKEGWQKIKSPSAHAVFDLYTDCLIGRNKNLARTAEILDRGISHSEKMDSDELQKNCIQLYKEMNLVIQYLGIMHERNEYSNTNWDFPRPLYNFVIIKEDINSK